MPIARRVDLLPECLRASIPMLKNLSILTAPVCRPLDNGICAKVANSSRQIAPAESASGRGEHMLTGCRHPAARAVCLLLQQEIQ